MTRKNFIAIAAVIAAAGPHATPADIARKLAVIFKDDNSRFDREKFLAACGAN